MPLVAHRSLTLLESWWINDVAVGHCDSGSSGLSLRQGKEGGLQYKFQTGKLRVWPLSFNLLPTTWVKFGEIIIRGSLREKTQVLPEGMCNGRERHSPLPHLGGCFLAVVEVLPSLKLPLRKLEQWRAWLYSQLSLAQIQLFYLCAESSEQVRYHLCTSVSSFIKQA